MSNFNDLALIFFLLAIFVFGSVLVLLLINPINTAFSGADIEDVGKSVVNDFDTQIPSIIDWFTIILFVGLPLIAFGLAFINNIPSFFYWLSFLLVIVVSAVGWIVKSLWIELISPTTVSDVVSTIPLTNFIFSNFVVYSLIVWFLLAVGTYVKTSNLRGGF